MLLMTKYHIKKDGTPGICRAKGKCPLGGQEEHFETKEQAQIYVNDKLAEQYDFLPSSKDPETTSDSYLYSNYQRVKNKKEDPGSYERFLENTVNEMKKSEQERIGFSTEFVPVNMAANYEKIKGTKEDPGTYHKFLEETIVDLKNNRNNF